MVKVRVILFYASVLLACMLAARAAVWIGDALAEPAPAWAKPAGPCTGPEYVVKRSMSFAERAHRGRRVTTCAFHAIVPAELGTALAVGFRESRFDPFAYNASSGASGLFQHLKRYWPGRRATYLQAREYPNTWPRVSPFNARANAILTARMVKRGGWGPWGL